MTTYQRETKLPVIGFDMGGIIMIISSAGFTRTSSRHASVYKTPYLICDYAGTSTDVSRFAGQYEHVFETTTAGVTIQAPQVHETDHKALYICIFHVIYT